MNRPHGNGYDHDGQEHEMDNVVPLRGRTGDPFSGPPVARPNLDARVAQLRAEGTIGGGAAAAEATGPAAGGVDVDERPAAVEGEVLPALGRRERPRWVRQLTQPANEPLLPVWLRSTTVARQRAWYAARTTARVGAWWTLRTPVVAAYCVPPVARGVGMGFRGWWRWVSAAALEERVKDVRGEVSKTMWEEMLTKANSARKARAWVTAIGAPVSGLSVWVGDIMYGAMVPWTVGGAVVVAAGIAGARRGESFLPIGAPPPRPIEPGMALKALNATMGEVFDDLKLKVTVLRSIAHPWGWDVEIMAGQALAAIEKQLDEIETRLRTRKGAVSLITDSGDAGRAVLRIVYADPFASMPAPPARTPGTVSVKQRHSLGKTLGGSDLALSLLAHTAFIGKSGSGKSSALWTDLDLLTAASDVIVLGIDLSDGPALNIWGDCISQYATSPAAAEGLLMYALAIGHARASVMGRRLRPTADSNPDEDVDENWPVTDAEPAFVLVIDEYPLMVEAGLNKLVEEYLRVARKAAGLAHIASQRAGRTEMGTTTVKTMVTNKVLLACESADVEMFLGPGRRAQGWRPDRLQPATPGHANDAGRCYVDAPGHETPQLAAVYRLTAQEARRRAIQRLQHIREHGRATFDQATLQAADAYARRRWDMGLDDLLTMAGPLADGAAVVDAHDDGQAVAQVLLDVRAAFERAGADRLPTAQLLQLLAEVDGEYSDVDATELASRLRPYGVRPGQLGRLGELANPNGYRRRHVDAAIEGQAQAS